MNLPVFVISLKCEKARRKRMEKEMDKLDIPFTFFDAVDGRDFDVLAHPDYHSSRRRRCFGRDLTGGELGCLLSHKGVFEKIINDDIDHALILEDDAILSEKFPKVVQALPDCPVPFDIVRFLGSPKVEKRKCRRVYEVLDGSWLVRMPTTPGGAHAYYIRKSGAQKMLARMKRNALPIDTLIGRAWETGAEVYAVKPGLATQDLSFESAIGEQRFNKKVKLKGSQRFIFPFTRGFFKLEEGLGKKRIYYSRILKDMFWRSKKPRRNSRGL